MRGIRAILMLLAVFIGQAHACSDSYVRADGSACAACVSIPSHLDPCKKPGLVAKAGDCHACCTLRSCDDRPGHTPKAAQVSFHWVMDLPLGELKVVFFTQEPQPKISIRSEDQFANPPPIERPSRAPPVRLS